VTRCNASATVVDGLVQRLASQSGTADAGLSCAALRSLHRFDAQQNNDAATVAGTPADRTKATDHGHSLHEQ
jgi:hypothetical protein